MCLREAPREYSPFGDESNLPADAKQERNGRFEKKLAKHYTREDKEQHKKAGISAPCRFACRFIFTIPVHIHFFSRVRSTHAIRPLLYNVPFTTTTPQCARPPFPDLLFMFSFALSPRSPEHPREKETSQTDSKKKVIFALFSNLDVQVSRIHKFTRSDYNLSD